MERKFVFINLKVTVHGLTGVKDCHRESKIFIDFPITFTYNKYQQNPTRLSMMRTTLGLLILRKDNKIECDKRFKILGDIMKRNFLYLHLWSIMTSTRTDVR